MRAFELSHGLLLGACVALTILLRLPLLDAPLTIDEAGYAYVASHWGVGGGGLYGAQWVDRPPLLFGLFAIADAAGGDLGVRVLGCIAAVVVVVACTVTARLVAGPMAATWAGVTSAVLVSSPLFQGYVVNAELPAIAFVSICVVVVVRAATGVAPAFWSGVLAGCAAGCAMLVKQSFADGFVFAGACTMLMMLLASGSQRRCARRIAAGVLCGAALTLGIAVAWAELVGPGSGVLLHALYGFRVEAMSEIRAWPNAPEHRAAMLGVLVTASGVLLLFLALVVGLARSVVVGGSARGQRAEDAPFRAVCGALAVLGLFEAFAVLMGGNFWRHYLLQLVPMLGIGVGVVVAGVDRDRAAARIGAAARRSCAWALGLSLAVWVAIVAVGPHNLEDHSEASVGAWLRSASTPGDTLLVTWGRANVLRESGMRTPYEMAWSLPIRVRDGQLRELRGVLAGPDAPTWIVRWNPISSWDFDEDGSIRALVHDRYERVGMACGHRVYRLRGADDATTGDSLPAMPMGDECGAAIAGEVRAALLW
jgi:hypothetical protein